MDTDTLNLQEILDRNTRIEKDNVILKNRILHLEAELEYKDLSDTFLSENTVIRNEDFEIDFPNPEHNFRAVFSGIFHTLIDNVYVFDSSFNYIYVSRNAFHVYGYTKNQLLGQKLGYLSDYTKNNLDDVYSRMNFALQGKPQKFHYWAYRKDGSVLPELIHIIKGRFKGVDAIFMHAVDITQEMLNKKAIQLSEDTYRSIFESVSDSLIIFNKSRKVLKVSDNILENFSLDSDDIINKDFLNFFSVCDEEKTYINQIFKDTFKSGTKIQFTSAFTDMEGNSIPVDIRQSKGNYFGEDVVICLATNITSKRRVEIDQKEREQSYFELFNNTTDLLFIIDESGCCIRENKIVSEVLKTPDNFFLGSNVFEILFKNQIDVFKDRIKVLDSEEIKSFQVHTQSSMNHDLFFEIKMVPTQFFNKKMILLQCHDITESEKQKQEIIDQQNILQSTIRAANVFQMKLDVKSGEMSFLDELSLQIFQSILGFEDARFHMFDYDKRISSEATIVYFREYIKKVLSVHNDTPSIQIELSGKTKQYWFDVHAQINVHECTFVDLIVKDVTSVKLVNDKLRVNEQMLQHEVNRFNRLFDSLFLSVTIIRVSDDRENISVININEIGAQLLHQELDYIIGKDIFKLIPVLRDHFIYKRFIAMKDDEDMLLFKAAKYTRCGIDIYLDTQISKLSDNEYVIMHRDVTEIIHSQQQIVNQNKHLIKAIEKSKESERLKTAFLANMSHEIRTPMNGILGFAKLLQNPELTGEKQQGYLTIIKESGLRLLNTVNDIIDISKIESGQIKKNENEIRTRSFFNEIYNFFLPEYESKEIQLIMNVQEDCLPEVFVIDEEKLHSILTNIVKNALKYTDRGYVHISISFEDNVLQMTVEDSGIGIPQEELPNIFDRFIQVNSARHEITEGSGIGLSITTSYVDLLGGNITVVSEVSKGTTFNIQIPVVVQENHSEIYSLENNQEDLSFELPLQVLIAEDDPVSLEYLYIILSEYKRITTFTASNGAEAVELFKKHPSIDIVFMDVRMPVMDGYEASSLIKGINPQATIVIQTANTFDEDKKRAMKNGCDAYITKPIDEQELKQLILEVVEGKRKYTVSN